MCSLSRCKIHLEIADAAEEAEIHLEIPCFYLCGDLQAHCALCCIGWFSSFILLSSDAFSIVASMKFIHDDDFSCHWGIGDCRQRGLLQHVDPFSRQNMFLLTALFMVWGDTQVCLAHAQCKMNTLLIIFLLVEGNIKYTRRRRWVNWIKFMSTLRHISISPLATWQRWPPWRHWYHLRVRIDPYSAQYSRIYHLLLVAVGIL